MAKAGITIEVPYKPGSKATPEIHLHRKASCRATFLVLRLSDKYLSSIDRWTESDIEARLQIKIGELMAGAKERAAKSLIHEKGI